MLSIILFSYQAKAQEAESYMDIDEDYFANLSEEDLLKMEEEYFKSVEIEEKEFQKAMQKNNEDIQKSMEKLKAELDNIKMPDISGFINTFPPEMQSFYKDMIADDFIKNIATCIPSEFSYYNPIHKQNMKRIIKGIRDDKCEYEETFYGGSTLNCKYPKDKLTALSKEYKSDKEKLLKHLMMPPSVDGLIFKFVNDANVCRLTSSDGRDITTLEDATEEDIDNLFDSILNPMEEYKNNMSF
jgi:hypothetical protein